ncbi:hypothetical protein [Streptomyces sp. NPDC005533]|uniref:hypothetical protein n=1 Tax=Streptomyces sp. NPDC005533 TaxID=3364723 RepID=UPI0036BA28A1
MSDRFTLAALAGSLVLVPGAAGLIGFRITARIRELGAGPVSLCAMNAYPEHVYTDLVAASAMPPAPPLPGVAPGGPAGDQHRNFITQFRSIRSPCLFRLRQFWSVVHF